LSKIGDAGIELKLENKKVESGERKEEAAPAKV
jgi:hypothetical protein